MEWHNSFGSCPSSGTAYSDIYKYACLMTLTWTKSICSEMALSARRRPCSCFVSNKSVTESKTSERILKSVIHSITVKEKYPMLSNCSE